MAERHHPPHPHDHHHAHPHDLDHAHPHDLDHVHPHDHNAASAAPHHLHSHMEADDRRSDLEDLTAQFVEGYRQAGDKTSYLRIAGIPFELDDEAGGAPLKLVDVTITSAWQVGTASPAFGSRELVWMPFPGAMVRERTEMAFVYVSLARRRDVPLAHFLAARAEGAVA